MLAAMSGGVDSAVTALLLLREGYTVEGVTLRLLDPAVFPCARDSEGDIRDAAAVSAALGIPHSVLDVRDVFLQKVADPFARAYRDGLTPNPCLGCNRSIKFGLLLEYALQQGFDALATGHYARLTRDAEGFYLRRAGVFAKDQSYVLYNVKSAALPHILLPLGDYDKQEVRALAAAHKLPVASRPDSQDICFIKGESYGDFIRRRLGEAPCGDILDEDGTVVGQHTGLDNYTVGQRKGVGGLGEAMYVLSKDAAENRLTVGKDAALYKKQVRAVRLNWFSPPPPRFRALVKLRYGHKGDMAWAELSGDELLLSFDKEQRAPTPGQAAVLYDGDRLLGGGEIC